MLPASPIKREQLADAWASPETSATALLAVLLDLFGTECMGWEPEIIREQLDSALGVRPAQREIDRCLALITALTTDMAHTNVAVFHHTMNALNGSAAVFDTWDPVDLDELTWGLSELQLNDRAASADEWRARFSPDVQRYIGLLAGGDAARDTLPQIVKETADFADDGIDPMSDYADDPVFYQAARDTVAADARDAENYAQARLRALLAELDALPLTSRVPDWKASVVAAQASGSAV